ncbi:MAG: FAD-dependent monooxygenase, partial [Archangium sp.]|nr:FAD-dependent monooxygenase [Archangium sp.]
PSGVRSTWIVECRAETWSAAGLDTKSEAESVAFLESLFADELGGHRLVANKSIWRTFPTIRCQTWHRGNLVLLGDAAHTAHFSIGSGTKLAMEDAVALVDAFRATGPNVGAALERYEATRKPEVERIQHAAQTSLEWFENAPRYAKQSPLQHTFNLMTRSKRITWNNLRQRDPGFVKSVDEWFATTHGTRRNSDESAPPPLFAPLRLRGLELPNRIVVSPMCQYSATDGVPNDWHLVHLGARAVGGAGLVLTEMTDVSPEGRITFGCAGIWNDAQAAAWKRVVEFVHQHSASRIGMQLAHAGRKASCRLPWNEGGTPLSPSEGAWATLAPSALPFSPKHSTPQEMTSDDLQRVKLAFVEGARRAAACGFDLIELHAAHGYLLSSFLSPLSNHRRDAYGGSLENRMRYPLEVFDAVRAVWPAEKPMSVRVTATDWLDEGLTVEETVVFARALKAHGCDVVDVSSGGNVPESKPVFGRMYQVPFAEAVRFGAEIPVMAVGAILNADHANTVLAAGRADLCALARPHLSDPSLTHRHAQDEGVDSLSWPKQYLMVQPRRG